MWEGQESETIDFVLPKKSLEKRRRFETNEEDSFTSEEDISPASLERRKLFLVFKWIGFGQTSSVSPFQTLIRKKNI